MSRTDISHIVIGSMHARLGVVSALVLTALALAPGHASDAWAANVANPNPALIGRWEPCEPDTGVTVIVDDQSLGEGKVYVGCAPGEQADGVQALEHAGFALEGTTDYGLAFICRIDGQPTPAQEPCTTTPGADASWSYWHGKPGGRWSFSAVGAKSPESRAPVGSIEGWSFGSGGAPRIEPIDGSGPSTFVLPPAQPSSVIPASLARSWLTRVLMETAAQAQQEEERETASPEPEEVLLGVLALVRAGVEPSALQPVLDWLERTCEEHRAPVGSCALRFYAYPRARREERVAARFALTVLGLQALDRNPASFAGENLLAALEGMVEKSGEVEDEGETTAAVEAIAPVVLALARTGPLTETTLKTVDLLVASEDETGDFEEAGTAVDVEAIEALVAAREQGDGVLGAGRLERVQAAVAKAGVHLESIQEADGGIRQEDGASLKPSVESTALGAVGLALSGRQAAAERAAMWVSRYQVTAEYAGVGDPETDQHTPAEDVIGAFLPGEAALRNALAFGVGSNFRAPFFEAQLPTIDALLALVTAGPYGPYDAAFAEESLSFETRAVGSQSRPLTITVTNRDVRPVTLTAIGVLGEQAGDFRPDGSGCVGKTLAPGESCACSAVFAPAAPGLREALLEVSLGAAGQTIELPLTGTATPEQPKSGGTGGAEPPAQPPSATPPSTSAAPPSTSAAQGALASRQASPARVQAPRLNGDGFDRGLIGVSWRVLASGADLSSWTISSMTLGAGSPRFVARASGGAGMTSALLHLPPGFAYRLEITVRDSLGRSATTAIGKVLVPHDDRWRGLRYDGRWQRTRRQGAWLGTVSRASRGAQVSVRLPAGRPVFVLRATPSRAEVEVSEGAHDEVFQIAPGARLATRRITAASRARAGKVRLRVLAGRVDLDGVADEG